MQRSDPIFSATQPVQFAWFASVFASTRPHTGTPLMQIIAPALHAGCEADPLVGVWLNTSSMVGTSTPTGGPLFQSIARVTIGHSDDHHFVDQTFHSG